MKKLKLVLITCLTVFTFYLTISDAFAQTSYFRFTVHADYVCRDWVATTPDFYTAMMIAYDMGGGSILDLNSYHCIPVY